MRLFKQRTHARRGESSSFFRDDPELWLPIGITAAGTPLEVPLWLPELGAVRSLNAGISGSGKSSIDKQRLLQAILNKYFDVYIIDAKGSEYGAFEPYAKHYATDKKSIWEQINLLDKLVSERAETLKANLQKGLPRYTDSWNYKDDGQHLYWKFDEIGRARSFLNVREQAEFEDKIFGIASVGRSLGISIDFTSQTFNYEILPPRIRDNCFDIAIGYQLGSFQESKYLGFTESDEVRPDLIKGKLLKSGRTSTVGQFAIRGLGPNTYGKSYFLSSQQIRTALSALSPMNSVEGVRI